MKWKGWGPVVAVTIAAASLLAPVRAHAEEGPGGTDFSWQKTLDYAACVVGIATIETGTGFVLAGIACGRAAANWWTE